MSCYNLQTKATLTEHVEIYTKLDTYYKKILKQEIPYKNLLIMQHTSRKKSLC